MNKAPPSPITLEDFLKYYERDLVYLDGMSEAIRGRGGKMLRTKINSMRSNLNQLKKSLEEIKEELELEAAP